MRYLLCTVVLLCVVLQQVQAQSTLLKEWFRQKKTQKEYLLKQIAALEAYVNLAKKGYKIYQSGLTSIGQLKKGAFELHDQYFNSLIRINPVLGSYQRVKDIVDTEYNILSLHRELKEIIRSGKLLQTEEKRELLATISKIAKEAENLLQDLTIILTPDAFEMKDDERILRIDKIYSEILILYQSSRKLSQDIIIIQRARKGNHMDIQTIQKISKP